MLDVGLEMPGSLTEYEMISVNSASAETIRKFMTDHINIHVVSL